MEDIIVTIIRMNTKEETTQRQSGISGESALAIISVALAAFWIAFAYYHGGSTGGNGNRILLLHPLVPIALIALLIRIYRYVGIKFVVHLEIIMIGLWIFVRMLGVFMPFILGFGFAYLFRFLWRALPFKKYYQRAIATVLIVVVCTSVLIFTGIAVGNQLNQMAKGLQKYFHETLLPAVASEEFIDIVYDEIEEEPTLFLATNHGIYFYNLVKSSETVTEKIKDKRKGITNGKIIGKKINAISVNNDYIYAGTDSGLYRCSKKIVQVVLGKTEEPDNSNELNGETEESDKSNPIIGFFKGLGQIVLGKKKESVIALSEGLEWKKIEVDLFNTLPIQTINTPSWNSELIYAGTTNGLYISHDSGKSWGDDKSQQTNRKNIDNITSIEKFDAIRGDIPKSTAQKKLPLYFSSINDADETKDKLNSVVYKRKNPSEEWNLLDNLSSKVEKLPEINKLVSVAFASPDYQAIELYAGTTNGVFSYQSEWNELMNNYRLPKSISLLATTPSGLFAGNDSIIYYQPIASNAWHNKLEKKNGIIAYRDDPIVLQFQDYLTEKIPGWTASGGAFVKWLSGLAGSIAFQFGGFIATLFLAFIVFVYASQGFDKYTRGFINLVPERHRETTMAYLREIDRNMHQFLKGQFIVIVIISIISCIVYHIIGVPFALLVGILAGLCNAIPTFGPFIGGGFAYSAMLMGLAAGEFTDPYNFLFRCLLVLGAILGIQTIDNSLISPNVMSNAVDIDPLLIMFAVIVGASILGFWGVLLAIPIIVVIKSILTVSKAAANGADLETTQEQS